MLKRPLSLQARLLAAATLALLAFLGLTGAILDRAFADSAQQAVRDRLQGHIYTLLASADLIDGELFVPEELPEPRLSRPGSGLYALITAEGQAVWRSTSTLDLGLPIPGELAPMDIHFVGPEPAGDERVFLLSMGVLYEDEEGSERRFGFHAAENLEAFEAQIQRFRGSLWRWLGGVVFILLLVQGGILAWSLRPLRLVADQVAEVENARRDQLDGKFPAEIAGLTSNLNALIRSEREHLDRYRRSLSDLAHSLKTPLAVMQAALESRDSNVKNVMAEQLTRMDDIVAYQLQRASTAGHATLSSPIAVTPQVEQIVASLEKVHSAKQVSCEFEIQSGVQFYGERGDLLELLGNLLENAFKWCGQRVLIKAVEIPAQSGHRSGLHLEVHDDGPGIPEDKLDQVLQRGVRADQRVQGHGIGLSIVQDIVDAYHGTLNIGRSDLGGAEFTIRIRYH